MDKISVLHHCASRIRVYVADAVLYFTELLLANKDTRSIWQLGYFQSMFSVACLKFSFLMLTKRNKYNMHSCAKSILLLKNYLPFLQLLKEIYVAIKCFTNA